MYLRENEFLDLTIKNEKAIRDKKSIGLESWEDCLSRNLWYQGIIKQVYMTKKVIGINVAADKGQGKSHLPEYCREWQSMNFHIRCSGPWDGKGKELHTLFSVPDPMRFTIQNSISEALKSLWQRRSQFNVLFSSEPWLTCLWNILFFIMFVT